MNETYILWKGKILKLTLESYDTNRDSQTITFENGYIIIDAIGRYEFDEDAGNWASGYVKYNKTFPMSIINDYLNKNLDESYDFSSDYKTSIELDSAFDSEHVNAYHWEPDKDYYMIKDEYILKNFKNNTAFKTTIDLSIELAESSGQIFEQLESIKSELEERFFEKFSQYNFKDLYLTIGLPDIRNNKDIIESVDFSLNFKFYKDQDWSEMITIKFDDQFNPINLDKEVEIVIDKIQSIIKENYSLVAQYDLNLISKNITQKTMQFVEDVFNQKGRFLKWEDDFNIKIGVNSKPEFYDVDADPYSRMFKIIYGVNFNGYQIIRKANIIMFILDAYYDHKYLSNSLELIVYDNYSDIFSSIIEIIDEESNKELSSNDILTFCYKNERELMSLDSSLRQLMSDSRAKIELDQYKLS